MEKCFIPILESLFDELNKAKIRYCIVRDYDSFNSINNAGDLDISICLKDKNRASNVLDSSGWKKVKYAVNDYSHTQYYKWQGSRFYKLDVIWGFYFDDGHYCLNPRFSPYDNNHYIGNAKLAKPEISILLLLSHIAFDKKALSPKNRLFLNFLHEECHKYYDLFTLVERLLSTGNACNDDIANIQKTLLKEEIVIKNNCFTWDIYKFLQKIRLRLYKKCCKKQYKVVLIGVDGTGKSTALNSIYKVLGDKVHTEYFGFRAWKTDWAKKEFEKPSEKKSPMSFLKHSLVMFLEMKHRYREAVQSKKPLLVFDRYVWEAYINTDNKIAKIVYTILFKWLFAKPNGIIYLYCPVETSLQRKDDIEDVNVFSKMKERFDCIYFNKKNSLSIDTSKVNEEVELDLIANFLFDKTNGAVL